MGLKLYRKLSCSNSRVNLLSVMCFYGRNLSLLRRLYIAMYKLLPLSETQKINTSASNLQAALAREPLILRRSTNADGVMSFILGTSACNRNQPSSSKRTLEFIFSLSFPLFHFYSPQIKIIESKSN